MATLPANDKFPMCARVMLRRPPLFGSPRPPVETTIVAIEYDDRERPVYVRTAEEKNRWFMANTGHEAGVGRTSTIERING